MHSKRQCARSPPEWMHQDVTRRGTHMYQENQLLKGIYDEATLHK